MLKSIRKMTLAAVLAATTFAAVSPAEARDRWRDHHDDTAVAIGAGVVGLALGAAIASDHGGRYYHDRYYRSYPRYETYYYESYPRYYYRDYPRGYYRDYRRDYRGDWRGNRGWGRGHYRRGWGY